VEGQPVPNRNEEYLLYQTLVGAWPHEPVSEAEHAEFVGRIQGYMFKALREAKVHASWVNPNPDYEAALRRFVAAVLDRAGPSPFLADFVPFQQRVSAWGMYNSLAQTLLKLTAPGVPDIYQGTELWDLSLVDPDNRRPVDCERRRRLLEELVREASRPDGDLAGLARELLARKADGRIKLYVTHRALAFRRDHAPLFLEGDYVPLEARGERRHHLCAFARSHGSAAVVVAVPRLVARLAADRPPLGDEVWGETWLPLPAGEPATYRNLFTGGTVDARERDGRPALSAGRVFQDFPVALLAPEATS